MANSVKVENKKLNIVAIVPVCVLTIKFFVPTWFIWPYHCEKKWVVLTHFSYLSFIPFSMSLNNFYSPMTFTNDLENQIKLLRI